MRMHTESSGPGGVPKKHVFLHGCFFAVILVLFAFVIYRQLFLPPNSRPATTTLLQHIRIAERIGDDKLDGHDRTPHKGFHHGVILFKRLSGLSFRSSGFVFLTILCVLTALVIYRILRRRLPSTSVLILLGATFILMTAAALYLPFFNRAVYYGQGSPTVWHNGTMIALKPVALVAFYLNVALINRSPDAEPASTRHLVLLAGLNLFTVYIKPTFIFVFLPAVGLFLLPRLRRPDRVVRNMMIVLAPTVLLLLYQFYLYSGWRGHTMGVTLFAEWRVVSPSIPVSVLLAVAFPLAVAVITWKRLPQNNFLRLAWIMTLVGIAQFAVLAEYRSDGSLLAHGNFIGGYLMGLSVLFLFSMEEYIRWLHHAKAPGLKRKALVALTIILIAGHTFSGWYYLSELLLNRRTRLVRHNRTVSSALITPDKREAVQMSLRALQVEDVETSYEAVVES